MQSAAVAWLMTSLTASPVLIAMVPFTAFGPVMLFGLFGGALADTCNRRNWLLATQSAMLLAALALGIITQAGLATPSIVLALTFMLGTGAALTIPAWQSLVRDLVPIEHIASAVSLNSMSFNFARMLGPVAGGLLTGATGPAAVFYLNAGSYLAVIMALFRWKNPTTPSPSPNGLYSMLAEGLSKLLVASDLRGPFLRVTVLCFFASAGTALLPVLARAFHIDAARFGILLGSFGAGALLGGASVLQLRAWFTPRTLVTLFAFVTGAALVALACAPSPILAVPALVLYGFAWIAAMVNLNVAVQTSAPDHLRGRAMALYFVLFQGSLAIGSLLSGFVARQAGTRSALLIAGIGLALCTAALVRTSFPSSKAAPHRAEIHCP